MTGRERFLTALRSQKPDRLPCQVHSWMQYYLDTYLGGVDQFAAYERFDMDPVIYAGPNFDYATADLEKWQLKRIDLPDRNGNTNWKEVITTPKGTLSQTFESNQYTMWLTEHPIKSKEDFELWKEFVPLPTRVDWKPIIEIKKRIKDTGIVRGHFYDFGQCSPWQSFCYLYGTQDTIMTAMDEPDWMHYALDAFLEKKLTVIERGEKFQLDLVECGGGAGSSTVISPDLHRQFCLPYDKKQIAAIHNAGSLVTYHLCGGLMPLLDIVIQNGADAIETMTPPAMGGDCDLAKATQKLQGKLCMIGGFDQNKGFESGTPEAAQTMVRELFEASPHGGYICSPSDHFFFGNPENIQAFADTARNCKY